MRSNKILEFIGRLNSVRFKRLPFRKYYKDITCFDLKNLDLKCLNVPTNDLDLEKGKVYKFKFFSNTNELISFEKV